MAIPEELKGTVFSYCRETEDQGGKSPRPGGKPPPRPRLPS